MRPRPGWDPRAVAGCGGRWLVREKPWAGICRIPGVEPILRVWLIHLDLADSLVLGWFGEISLSLWCRLILIRTSFFGIRLRVMQCRHFAGLYIEAKVRVVSRHWAMSLDCARPIRKEIEASRRMRGEEERDDGRTKGRAGLARWRCEDVASRPKRERKFYGLHAKRLMLNK